MKKLTGLSAIFLLCGCSWNGITGFEGAQGYSGQEYFQVTFTVDENGNVAAEPKKVLYVSGKENSTSAAYIEVVDKVLVMFDASGTKAFPGQEIRGNAQSNIAGDVTDLGEAALDAVTGPIPLGGAE